MNNFGVVELASARTTNAPGWAYVPDLGPNASTLQAHTTSNRKRGARTQAAASKFSYADVDARHDARIRKELEGLDRDNQARDAAIPVPPSRRMNPRTRGELPSQREAGSSKNMANVRRILQSQKTFANHLDDYVALLALNGGDTSIAGATGGGGSNAASRSTTAAAPASAKETPASSPAPSSTPRTAASAGSLARKKSTGSSLGRGGLGNIPVINSKMSYARREQLMKRIEEHKRLMAQQEQDAEDDDVEMADAPTPKENRRRSTKNSAAVASTPVATPTAKRQKATPAKETPTAKAKEPAAVAATTANPAPAATSMKSENKAKDQEEAASEEPKPIPPSSTSLLALPSHPLPTPDPKLDNDPLLVSRVPPLPSDEELRALLNAPPLSYLEIKAAWPGETQNGTKRYPARVFCELCGYWGRVKCMKCGTRVCALDCLDTHKEECVTRYGI